MESIEGKKGSHALNHLFLQIMVYMVVQLLLIILKLLLLSCILEKGGQWFLELGKPNNGGTKIFCVSGHVNKPGNFEVRLGIPFSELLELAGGVRKGHKLKQ